jgi:NADH-quinone oxidoreductase subunit M
MDILGFLLAYAIKIPLIPFHLANKCVSKAPTVGTMLYLVLLKMDCTALVLLAPLAAKEYMYIFMGLGIAGVIYGSIVALKQKI